MEISISKRGVNDNAFSGSSSGFVAFASSHLEGEKEHGPITRETGAYSSLSMSNIDY